MSPAAPAPPRDATRPAPAPGPRAPAEWQRQLAAAIRDPAVLLARLGFAPAEAAPLLAAAAPGAAQFPVVVPEAFAARMRPRDPADPLLRQVLPLAPEGEPRPGYVDDPLEEAAATAAPGLLEKYPGRALLVTTGVCAIHCRYCFRRHFPYREGPLDEALEALATSPDIEEVLLSGGDPLALSPARFARLVTRLDAIPHLRRIRLHTRLPVVLPARVDASLLRLLRGLRARVYVVLHSNHARELDDAVAAAIDDLRGAGAVLLNQAVLLRGVNDGLDAQVDLSRRLIDLGVVPYYLHRLDPVRGAHHFAVSPEVGRALIDQMRARLPGYAVPAFVEEIPGAASKLPV